MTHLVTYRTALPSDAGFLADMVVAAINWAPGRDWPRDVVLADPHNRHYVDGWPGAGELGVIAEVTGPTGNRTPAGAAWLRFFTANDPGYGYVADGVPELSIGVVAAYRGNGIGTALLRHILEDAKRAGIARISLSVERLNPAARLYERLGFRVCDPRDGEVSMTMLIDLGADGLVAGR